MVEVGTKEVKIMESNTLHGQDYSKKATSIYTQQQHGTH